ncbi:MAG: sigma 54-interacting transcriptional regulator [Deltaproteobacteria bacterium]|nr:sigma 54-interacting transcriptional regulator [Deltaproteobacteria bacterium]
MHDSYTPGAETVAATLLAEHGNQARQAQLFIYQDGEGKVFDVPDGSTITFGRSRSSTVVIDSEKSSRNHARLVREGETITVEDLQSRNGTKVNDELITELTPLSSGDAIAIGPMQAVLSFSPPLRHRPVLGGTSYLEERLAAECDRGRRYRRSFALAMLHLDGSEDEADAFVTELANKTRPMDALAEYSPEELAILFPEADRQTTEITLQEILSLAKQVSPRLRVRAGAALFPTHASATGELLGKAHAAVREARRRERDLVIEDDGNKPATSGIIVEDPKMHRVFDLVGKVADSKMTVLINGETGTGKEVIAEALHNRSSRVEAPYLRLNCACLPENLLESELFGHERGSFTGADRRKLGYFEAADGGTIFLDEIGELPVALQSKLLRVLEENRFARVGGTAEIEVDVRVLCATNRDLAAEVSANRFRQDLYFRVSAFAIAIPPLRERKGEILPMAESFLAASAADLGVSPPTISEPARALLMTYPWPGNVRELRNAMERAVVLCEGAIDVNHLPDRLRDPSVQAIGSGAAVPIDPSDMRGTIADVERQSIVAALEACDGNQTKAAKKLGISRRSLIYKMEKHGLKKPPRSARPKD